MKKSDWGGVSALERWILEDSVGKFLRTHRDGYRVLLTWLDTVPVDRTEEQYKTERAEHAAAHEAAIRANLERFNAYRAANGLPPVDRDGAVMEES